jgi:hypothetical protein
MLASSSRNRPSGGSSRPPGLAAAMSAAVSIRSSANADTTGASTDARRSEAIR